MKMKVQVIVESDDGQTEVIREAIALDRGPLQADQLGLTLAEAKDLWSSVQQTMATCQVQEYAEQSRYCSVCGLSRPRKGNHEIVYRTLFGKLKLNSPRYYECSCAGQSQKSKSPLAALLNERAAPELVYLEARLASLMSYGLTVELLTEILPLKNVLLPINWPPTFKNARKQVASYAICIIPLKNRVAESANLNHIMATRTDSAAD